MKKYYLSLVFLGGVLSAQNTYVDVVTTAALKLYSDNLKDKQKRKPLHNKNKTPKSTGLGWNSNGSS